MPFSPFVPPPPGLNSWEELFKPAPEAIARARYENFDDVSVDDGSLEEAIGTGLPGERFDLQCGDCKSLMRLREGKHGPFYGCTAYSPDGCHGTHGCNPDGSPIGTPGDKETRKARIAAHKVFDRLWQPNEAGTTIMTRADAYLWLRRVMAPLGRINIRTQLSEKEGRISYFSAEQCHQLIDRVKRDYPEVQTVWDRIENEPQY